MMYTDEKEAKELVLASDVDHGCMRNIRRCYSHKSSWLKSAKKCFNYAVGNQWDAKAQKKFKEMGYKAVTVPKLQVFINLLVGLQSQGRSDIKLFPVGKEDLKISDTVNNIMKHSTDKSRLNYHITEMFRRGIICGEGWLEGYLDDGEDFNNAEIKYKPISSLRVFVDPDSKEKDLSDAKYVFKITKGLTKQDVIDLFPMAESKIKKISEGELTEIMGTGEYEFKGQTSDSTIYRADNNYDSIERDYEAGPKKYDLIDYYYKKSVTKYYLLDKETGELVEQEKEAAFKKEKILKMLGTDEYLIIKKKATEIWHKALIGNGHKIYDELAWCYPRWKSFPLFPFYARKHSLEDIDDSKYLSQGVILSAIDAQDEINMAHTLQLMHLNQVAHSGFIYEKGSVNAENLSKYGSAPGVNIGYKKGSTPPQKILPSPASQGHFQLIESYTSALREITGIPSDLLASASDDKSGRAIRLQQQQGMVMVQEFFDNLSFTSKLIGRFNLSMLGEAYDFDEVINILGQGFIEENFVIETPVLDPISGQVVPQKQIDEQGLYDTIENILDYEKMDQFDVVVSQGDNSETTKISNFMMLQDLSQTLGQLGLPPIPYEVMVEESLLNNATKEKTLAMMRQQQEQQVLLQGAVQ